MQNVPRVNLNIKIIFGKKVKSISALDLLSKHWVRSSRQGKGFALVKSKQALYFWEFVFPREAYF